MNLIFSAHSPARCAIVVGMLIWCGATRAAIIFVDCQAQPGGDGASWATAYGNLQDALGAAVWGDQVWVAAGAHRPAPPDGDRELGFELASGVVVCGGFAGDEDPAHFDLDNRDLVLNESVLSGDLNGNDGPGFAGYGENSHHVVIGDGCDFSAILDGFTITGGNADGPLQEGLNDGGGLYCSAGSPTIRNCRFIANSAVGSFGHGGAMFSKSGSGPAVTDCLFMGNRALYGGAVFDDFGQPSFDRCMFLGNTASGKYGGAMFANTESGLVVRDSIFTGNSARYGGAIYSNDFSTPQLA